jgi:hypothetical protein
MRRTVTAVTAVVISSLALVGGRSDAGPDKIAFPAGFRERLDLYTIAHRYDVKQYRELFAPKEAIAAARAGQPLPAGTVLVLIQYKAQADAQGNLLKNDKGRFLKGDLIGYTVMEKRAGWGAEYPPNCATASGNTRPSPSMASSTRRRTTRVASNATSPTRSRIS